MSFLKKAIAMTSLFVLTVSPVFVSADTSEFPDPVDTESWVLPEDMTWGDYNAVPGVDWNNDDFEAERTLRGALVLVDFPDLEFISSQEEGSDLAGNPIGVGNIPREELAQFWVDFLNKPQELNNYRTINEYWRENTYGKWEVELEGFGPYLMDYNEFQYGISGSDMPPGYEAKSIRPEALEKAKADLEASENDFDFVFILHAGYDESGVWQEFGEMKFMDRDSIPDEYGPPAEFGDLKNWANTRYVPWTSWFAAKAIWSHADISNGISVQGESDGMGVFAHEFGHIMQLLDNYNNPYGNPVSRTYSGPWELMSRGSFNGPGGPHTRWMITPTMGASAPSHHMLRNKIKQGIIDEDQYVNLDRDELKHQGVFSTDIIARAVPTGDYFGREGSYGINIEMEDLTPRNYLKDDWRADMQRGEKWYDNYTVEVVDRVGFDSFTPDSGVLIAKTKNSESAPNIWVIDANDEDINKVDFIRPNGEAAMYSVGDYRQLSDALFKAGTDENIKNEYVDEYNKLHFYILDKTYDDQGALSYRVAVRHLEAEDDFTRSVEGSVVSADYELPGNVERHVFSITNTGDSKDLFRINVDASGWETRIQHEVVEVAAGETVEVPVYVKVSEQIDELNFLTITATSETDQEQSTEIVQPLFNDLSLTGFKEVVNYLIENGDITENAIIKQLTNHLDALERFADSEDKFVKRLDKFMSVVEKYHERGEISENSYELLNAYADFIR